MITNTYRHTIEKSLSEREKIKLFEHIKDALLKKASLEIYVSEDTLYFKVPFFVLSWNHFAMVDKGTFSIEANNELIYSTSSLRKYIISAGMFITVGVISEQFLFFGSFYVISSAINWFRNYQLQKKFFEEIITYADTLETM